MPKNKIKLPLKKLNNKNKSISNNLTNKLEFTIFINREFKNPKVDKNLLQNKIWLWITGIILKIKF